MERKEVDLVYQELKKWFESYNIRVWLNEGENKFVVVGSREKPDMVIYSQKINQYIAIEVKKGERAKDVYDASKILTYYKQYVDGIKYQIIDKEIKIDSFAIATLQSMFGRLFLYEDNPKSTDDYKSTEYYKKDQWMVVNKERGLEPRWEYPQTHQYLRQLWANWRLIRKKEYSPGMGIILSNVLNEKELDFAIGQPLLFDMQWEILKKAQWKVRQKWL